ncbi:MAG: hypothetical protein Q9180_006486, partial [Flavoplaca navasiana]
MIDLAVAIMWTVYAGKGYARHMFYLKPPQLSHAGELNAISRSLCVLGIGIGKVSVAFLIERFAGPSKWRKYLLRSISVTIIVSALLTVILFYAQCRPVQALWDKSLLKAGKARCWDPVPLATLLGILGLRPRDHSRGHHLEATVEHKEERICAAVKTSKIPITVRGQTDITWLAIELLMWGGIEMNVIIIAACIPTLRPLFLVLLGRPSGSQYRNGASSRKSYSQHLRPNGSNRLRNPASDLSDNNHNKAFDSTTELHSMNSDKRRTNTIIVDSEILVESGD